ncbi:hypothetical protein GCK72_001172 [Caenorhabditis remanei]|uniref:Uncharacterized protein n=1 Tax=Caenorhabditis remanei TaxID=31234 RepID=A0A6A5HP11_CAERE|nr:hypothetical protein GCK72_001172 [Caenorhabditis remanei]KAF1769355.1 hypothetical protein GCK72_001172 [Caenorhabditis remanei]
MRTMKAEWRTCPRCKNQGLKPDMMSCDKQGYTKYWWICENFNVCNFPLDMPSNIYHVNQSPFQKRQKCIPLPNILKLPEKYRYLYPLTFSNSRPTSRCSSVVSNSANSRNETTIDSSDGTISEKSSGQDRLKADSVWIADNNNSTPSTSAQSKSETADIDNDNIDEEIEAAARKCGTSRTIRRKRFHNNSSKSWSSLIEKVAADPKASTSILKMEESELVHRMEEFFEDRYFQLVPTTFKRPGVRVTYQVEDVEKCLQTITHKDWTSARKRLTTMSVSEQVAMKTSNAEELLKSVGINLQERRKAVGEKVGKIMRGLSSENMPKRRKLAEEKRKVTEQKRRESIQNTIHKSVSARILNKKLRRDEEERSRASTPASSIHDFQRFDEVLPQEPASSSYYVEPDANPEPVQFHLGNETEDVADDQDHHWGFDLDGLYDSIHADNNTIPLDPHMDAILSQLDDPNIPAEHEESQERPRHLEEEQHHYSGDEADAADVDGIDFTGFGDDDGQSFGGNNNSNFDFVNDNFGF